MNAKEQRGGRLYWVNGARINELLRERHWTASALGARLKPEIPGKRIAAMLCGRKRVRSRTLEDIARVLGNLDWKTLIRTNDERRLPLEREHFRLPAAAVAVGRQKEIDWLRQACCDRTTRVVQIVGSSGLGKSTIAWHCLDRLSRSQPSIGIFAWTFDPKDGCSSRPGSDEFFAAVLRWSESDRGERANASLEPWRQLADRCLSRQMLLLLDGIEVLLEPEHREPSGNFRDRQLQLFVEALCRHPEPSLAKIILTSRMEIRDLAAAAPGAVQTRQLDPLAADAGRELFNSLGVRGPPETLEQAADALHGNALSIELVGAYVARYCNGDISHLWSGSTRRLALTLIGRADETAVDKGRQPVALAVAEYERILKRQGGRYEIALLHLLALFDSPVSRSQLEPLLKRAIPRLTTGLNRGWSQEWERAVTTLRGFRLIATKSGSADALDMHPVVRLWFAGRLQKKYSESAREAHKRLFQSLSKVQPQRPQTLLGMEPLFNAVRHGCLAGVPELAFRNAYWGRIQQCPDAFSMHVHGPISFGRELECLSWFFCQTGKQPVREIEFWSRQPVGLFAKGRAVSNRRGRLSPEHISLVWGQAAQALRAEGRWETARAALEGVLAFDRRRGCWHRVAIAGGHLSETCVALGRLDDGLHYALESIQAADRGRSDHYQRLVNRTRLGNVLHQLGRLDESANEFQSALALLRKASQRVGAEYVPQDHLWAFWGYWHCDLLLSLDDVEGARCAAKQALRWHRQQASQKLPLYLALFDLIIARCELADLPAHVLTASDTSGANGLAERLDRLVAQFANCGLQDYLAQSLLTRADLHRRLGHASLTSAEGDQNSALNIAQRDNLALIAADALLLKARMELAHNPQMAKSTLLLAQQRVQGYGYNRRQEELIALLAADSDGG